MLRSFDDITVPHIPRSLRCNIAVVTSSGTATLGGRPTHAVTLVPKRQNPNFTSAKVWIDDADSSIRQFDIETANGLKRHVVITSFTANPAISRASFRFVPPKGARIVDQASGAF